MKHIITRLAILLAVVIVPLVVLLVSYRSRLKKLSGNFERNFASHYTRRDAFDLKYNSYYIAGSSEGYLLLANHTITPRLLKIDKMLHDTQSVQVQLEDAPAFSLTHYEFIVDSPRFFIAYGKERTVFTGDCSDWQATPSKIRSPYFLECVPLSAYSMVYHYISSKTGENAFRKVSLSGEIIENDHILEKQVDGRFCTSGSLEYNRELNLLAYVYAYRNQVLVMDTNLNLVRKFKTIDDNDSVRFEVATLDAKAGKSVIVKPTIMVNPKSTTYKHYLVVHSKIMGKHEDDKKFERSTVLDFYDISTGKYISSIRLPSVEKRNISQVKIIDGYIYLMLGNYIQRYEVQLPD